MEDNIFDNVKEVDLKNYINVCWDYTNKIIPLRDIIRETLVK